MEFGSLLKYNLPAKIFLDTSFFQELARLKLDVLKLDTTELNLIGNIELQDLPAAENNGHLFLDSKSFSDNDDRAVFNETSNSLFGDILNFNTIENFKSLNKQEYIIKKGHELLCRGLTDINKSVGFSIISYCELKKYKFYYWVCFPCFQFESLSFSSVKIETTSISPKLVLSCQSWFQENPNNWIALLDKGNNNRLVPYSKNSNLLISKSTGVAAIKDSSLIENVPSAFIKNILSIIKVDYPLLKTIEIYFIRSNSSSFVETIEICTNSDNLAANSKLKVTGWVKNQSGKLLPSIIDLSVMIDPLKINEQSVKLNLKLMKWRIVPDLDLNIIENTSVLILGSGTLGCYISRALLAWGVSKITFVDNGKISYSNPVRQPLFNFEDYGKPKAVTAAEALKKIYPLVNAKGIQLNIPMIAHPVTCEEREKKEYMELCTLIKEHDVIFLVTDSREARWVPTILGKLENKIVINAALGFDSYLVMRHGNNENKLGCYFCQDIVAPGDSLKDRTLDEMCTVTRPGIALMAASQAVELMVSLLQSRISDSDSKNANNSDDKQCILGEIPHMIRGFLRDFKTLKLEIPQYECCSACNDIIIRTCEDEGWDFIKKALNDKNYIETLSGLDKVKDLTDDILDFDDEMSLSEGNEII
ncbi:hypothetical protein TBLA_0B07930 [Henningerozyma blattae CBS 6284]|uniref:Ubiquitin-like modifier-activating enzyme ATG7 n=1 Tax=Henningerozyma blattae (strain ATCC 34711 / CBS 6284 / DSM 70876 / NBRC 10599 / NRRL Y-10934 / UCD 77-7) TaxID=1071380 RepID=I2GZQ7_HENB6|nr:hypothetical protein TBLA_0B07930 [Tetrapisispora blattae CBS 6284]CCH59609.1 hypothetical protein TBLA_0B07930 [Tetrapisispora blattae CBS 6284]